MPAWLKGFTAVTIHPDMPAVASLRELSKIYRKPGTNVEVAALRSVDVDFEQGEYTAIMGASGSGGRSAGECSRPSPACWYRATDYEPASGVLL